MKTTRLLTRASQTTTVPATAIMALLATFLLVGAAANPVSAASGDWINNGNGNWSDQANWAGGPPGIIADGAGFTADFIFNPNTSVTVTLDTSRVIGHLSIGDTAATYRPITISPAASETLTFDNNGGGSTLTHGGGGSGTPINNTINTDIILADNLAIARNNTSPNRFFILNGDISETGGPRSISHTAAGDNAPPTEMTGVNTYTGDTTITSGGITFSSTSETRFVIQDANVSNSVLGDGTANFNGLFRLDISSLTASVGTWNLVDVANLTTLFDPVTFGLAFLDDTTFNNNNDGTYSVGNWAFNTTNGNLTLIPEPASLALLMVGGALIMPLRRKKM